MAMFLFFVPLFAGAQYSYGTRETQSPKAQEVRGTPTVDETKAVPKPNAIKSVREQLQTKTAEIKDAVREKVELRVEKKADGAATDVEKIRIQNAAAQTGEADAKDKVERVEKRTEALQKKTERQKELLEKRKARIQAYFEKMFKRLDAAIARQDVLADRIESRIKKFEAEKADVAEAKRLLTDARAAVDTARTALADAKSSVENILMTEENAKETFTQTKKVVESVVMQIKQAHKALVDSIVVLKGKRVNETTEE